MGTGKFTGERMAFALKQAEQGRASRRYAAGSAPVTRRSKSGVQTLARWDPMASAPPPWRGRCPALPGLPAAPGSTSRFSRPVRASSGAASSRARRGPAPARHRRQLVHRGHRQREVAVEILDIEPVVAAVEVADDLVEGPGAVAPEVPHRMAFRGRSRAAGRSQTTVPSGSIALQAAAIVLPEQTRPIRPGEEWHHLQDLQRDDSPCSWRCRQKQARNRT